MEGRTFYFLIIHHGLDRRTVICFVWWVVISFNVNVLETIHLIIEILLSWDCLDILLGSTRGCRFCMHQSLTFWGIFMEAESEFRSFCLVFRHTLFSKLQYYMCMKNNGSQYAIQKVKEHWVLDVEAILFICAQINDCETDQSVEGNRPSSKDIHMQLIWTKWWIYLVAHLYYCVVPFGFPF